MATQPTGKRPEPKKTAITSKKPTASKKAVGIAVPSAKGAAKTKAATKTKPNLAIKKVATSAKETGDLTDLQSRFVDEYLIDLNATQAAIRAGYSEKTAAVIGSENLIKPNIAAEIQRRKQERQSRTEITADVVLKEVWSMFRADARELVEVRVGCCRYCYGEGHKRQRTVAEMNAAREKWIDSGKVPLDFDEEGGIGYNPLLPPHAMCPECGGDGYSRVVAHDTRKLTPEAASLYAGAKMGKNGIEILMHDKVGIAEKLFKHLGLYEAHNKQRNAAAEALSELATHELLALQAKLLASGEAQ